MHASVNNCLLSPALTCSPLWRSRHTVFEMCGSLSITVGLTSPRRVPPVIQADTLYGVQTHMMKAGVIFPAAWATEMRLKRYGRTLLHGIPSVYSTIGKSLMEVSVLGKKLGGTITHHWDETSSVYSCTSPMVLWPSDLQQSHPITLTPAVLSSSVSGAVVWHGTGRNWSTNWRETEKGEVCERKKVYKRNRETIKGKLEVSVLTRLIMCPPFSPPLPQPLCLTEKGGKDECDMTAP